MRFAAGYVVDNETSTMHIIQKALAQFDVTKVQQLSHDTAIGLTFHCKTCGLRWSSWRHVEWYMKMDMLFEVLTDCAEASCSAHRCDLELGPAGRP